MFETNVAATRVGTSHVISSGAWVRRLTLRCSRLRPVTDYYYFTFLAWAEAAELGTLEPFGQVREDKYTNFEALASAEPDAYMIRVASVGSSVVVAAPHGGGIEPGTSEIALAVAGHDLTCYLFEGIKATANRDLHITSCRFDEPRCIALVRAAATVVTIHGEDSDGEVVFVGGLHATLAKALRAALERNGFVVREHSKAQLQGRDPRNICNFGRLGAGVQLELSLGLRRSFFHSLSRAGRARPTPSLSQFGSLVRNTILESGL